MNILKKESNCNIYELYDAYCELSFNWNVFDRNYSLDPSTPKLIKNYKNNVFGISHLNTFIPTTSEYDLDAHPYCRIISWNVRYFTDVYNKPNIHHVIDIILEQSPHIICLQEITLGKNNFYDTSNAKSKFNLYFEKLLAHYDVISVCSSPPAHYSSLYGNMMLIRKKFKSNIINFKGTDTEKQFIDDVLCIGITRGEYNKCFLNQQAFTYRNVPQKKIINYGDKLGNIKYQQPNNENKCFIKIILPMFDLICVHLDAYNKNDRLEQLAQINNEITRKTIIVGDFNFFNVDDFLDPLNYLKKKKNELEAIEMYKSWTYQNIETNLIDNILDDMFINLVRHNEHLNYRFVDSSVLLDNYILNYFRIKSGTIIDKILGKSELDAKYPIRSYTYLLYEIKNLAEITIASIIFSSMIKLNHEQPDQKTVKNKLKQLEFHKYLYQPDPLNKFLQNIKKHTTPFNVISDLMKDDDLKDYIFDEYINKVGHNDFSFKESLSIINLLNKEYLKFDEKIKKELIMLMLNKSSVIDHHDIYRDINIDDIIKFLFNGKNNDEYFYQLAMKPSDDVAKLLNQGDKKGRNILDKLWDHMDKKIIQKYNCFDYNKFQQYSEQKYDAKILEERIHVIETTLNNLYSYFFSIDKNHDIHTNEEFNYCIKTLKWDTTNSNKCINFSQWSGTRVDMAFYVNFGFTGRPPYFQYYMHVDKGSDHLPMIIDVYKNINYVDLLNVEKIKLIKESKGEHEKKHEKKRDKKIIQYNRDEIDCTKIRPMVHLDYSKISFRDRHNNGQPITPKSYDWILNGEFKELSDPHVSGGNGGLTMGYSGIYTTLSMREATRFGRQITLDKLRGSEHDDDGIYYSLLMFDFEHIEQKSPEKIRVGDASNFMNHDEEFAQCYDKKFDMFMIGNGGGGTITIFKFPEHAVLQFLKPKNIYIVGDIFEQVYTQKIDDNVVNKSNMHISESTIQRLINGISGFILTDKHKKIIRFNCKILINAIYFINELSDANYGKHFITFDENNLQNIGNTRTETGIVYKIDAKKYGPNIISGGAKINYYKKYIKYKSKYLKLNNR